MNTATRLEQTAERAIQQGRRVPFWVMLLAWFVLWTMVLQANIWSLYDDVVTRDFEVFGSDGQDTVALLADQQTSMRDYYKHPLFAIVGQSIHDIVGFFTGSDSQATAVWTLALIGGAVIAQMAALLRSYFGNGAAYWAGSAFFGLSFSTLVIFSIPETYCVTMLAILSFLQYFCANRSDLTASRAALMGVLIGLAALGNVTLLTAGLIPGMYMLLEERTLRRTVGVSFLIMLSSALTYLISTIALFGLEHLSFSRNYAEQWFGFANFTDLHQITSVIFQFTVFSVVGAGTSLQEIYASSDARSYIEHPFALLALVSYAILMGVAILDGIRKHHAMGVALYAWALAIVLLYIGFNPKEAILYSVQIVPVFVFTLMHALRDSGPVSKLRLLMYLLLVCMAVHNFGLLVVEVPAT